MTTVAQTMANAILAVWAVFLAPTMESMNVHGDFVDDSACLPIVHMKGALAKPRFVEKLHVLFPDSASDVRDISKVGGAPRFAVITGPLKGQPRMRVKVRSLHHFFVINPEHVLRQVAEYRDEAQHIDWRPITAGADGWLPAVKALWPIG